MTKFRKKPVVIEAFQMTKEARWDNSDWPNWLNQAWQKDRKDEGALFIWADDVDDGSNDSLGVHTLEGDLVVSWGDWIIQGVKGELYPCKPDIFDATYDEVED